MLALLLVDPGVVGEAIGDVGWLKYPCESRFDGGDAGVVISEEGALGRAGATGGCGGTARGWLTAVSSESLLPCRESSSSDSEPADSDIITDGKRGVGRASFRQ